MDSPFDSTKGADTFITDPDPFSEDYTPDEILCRDDVIAKYRQYLQPVLDGGILKNVFVRGPTGVGKTAITKRILEFLHNDAHNDDISFEYSHLNVKSNSTYESLLQLANSICDSEYRTGTNTSKLRRDIYEAIDEVDGYYILIIDECDKLDEEGESTFLYEFPRARSNGYVENTRIGLIGISNDLTYGEELEPRIKSSLSEREIEFEPYNAPELATILGYYAQLALRDECYTEAPLNYIAAMVAQETGDARMALDLLEISIEQAKEEGEDVISETHAKKAWESMDEKSTIRRIRRHVPKSPSFLLIVLAGLSAENATPVTFDELYTEYAKALTQTNEDPRSERQIRDHLNTLRMFGFLSSTEENAGMKGGRRYLYELDVDPNYVTEALVRDGIYDSVLSQYFELEYTPENSE